MAWFALTCLVAYAASTAAIVPPIAGLRASDVLDTFSQSRPGGRIHEATDILEPRGTPVRAMVDGTIEKLFLSKPGGNTIYEFDAAKERCYYYAHLDHYAEGLSEGQPVSRGEVIGYVGNTGNAANGPPHLHLAIFELTPERHWWQGTPINPYPILLGLLNSPEPGEHRQ
jgi:peptidoglycan LD-endopeptidase LytH